MIKLSHVKVAQGRRTLGTLQYLPLRPPQPSTSFGYLWRR